MSMCVVNRKSVNKLDLTWKQSFLIKLKSFGQSYKLFFGVICANNSVNPLDFD
jgi:hypothetical protein